VLVGGAPLTEEFAESIGANGYAYDAANAVEKVIALVGEG
jgi:5-methyltetrahydrofolate--homocysteine methyltransferase